MVNQSGHIRMKGLVVEKTSKGTPRYRVRVAGNVAKKITLQLQPSDVGFVEQYHAARRGIAPLKPGQVEFKISDGLEKHV